MRKQIQIFSQPFRPAYRHRRPPRLLQISNAKRRKAKQEFRRQKTAHLLDGAEPKSGVIDWSPEQLERIWLNTMG